nr:hypothetical protein [Methanobacterium formicicum]
MVVSKGESRGYAQVFKGEANGQVIRKKINMFFLPYLSTPCKTARTNINAVARK